MTTNDAPIRCERCDGGEKPIKMKRQYVHHDRSDGRIMICAATNLKPASA